MKRKTREKNRFDNFVKLCEKEYISSEGHKNFATAMKSREILYFAPRYYGSDTV